MNAFQIFLLQYELSFLVYLTLVAWYLWPRLKTWPLSRALMLLIWPHVIRHLGLDSLLPAVVDPTINRTSFAVHQAYGDLAAMILAFISLFALRFRWRPALWLVWLFNIVGLGDLLGAVIEGYQIEIWNRQISSFWNVITFLAPALFLSHLCIFVLLIRRSREYPAERPGS